MTEFSSGIRRRISPEVSSSNTNSRENLYNSATCLNLLNSIRLIVLLGLLSTLTFLALVILYFRPAILATVVPLTVISTTIYGILQRNHCYLWPIIGISWFHVFLTLYFELCFMYFFIFKPNYIIMVLNWAFDTLYTMKTVSYYIQCTTIIILTTAFGLFNLWQLNVLMNFKEILQHQKEMDNGDQPSQIISIVIEQEEQMSKY